MRVLRNAGVSVICQDTDLRIAWANNVPAIWHDGNVVGLTDADLFPAPVAERVRRAKELVLAGSAPEHLEIAVPADDGARWFSLWIDADRGGDDGICAILTTAVEITDQKRREETLRTLLREVSHRSKNLLAVIQSIATQTGRYSLSIDGFLTRFRGRIQSLASSQDLVTSSNWRGAHLHELVVGQVSRYSLTPQSSLRFEGDRPWLNPNAALHVGLALHELAVNSVSYGALSRPGGVVTVSSHIRTDAAGKESLVLSWAEDIVAADVDQREKRFGSVALERVVPASLNGTATLDIAPDRLDYTLTIPFGNFEVE